VCVEHAVRERSGLKHMSTVTSVVDPKILFARWFEAAITQLEKLKDGDGGTAGMMIVLPLFERYINILRANDAARREFYTIMAAELKLATAFEAEKFWTTFRHGFCHTGMPLEQGKWLKSLPKVQFAGKHSARPEFHTTPSGQDVVCLDPWKFIHYVMDIYRRDPTLLVRNPDAPLLGIHAIN
jgi:hypothetical protein